MHYLVTDQDCKTWRGHHWGAGVTNVEENPNYFFTAYSTPEKALLMYPAYEDFSQVRIWSAEGKPAAVANIKSDFKSLTSVEELGISTPTDEQMRSFALCCSLMLVNDAEFQAWGHRWLRGEDRSVESALRVQSAIAERVGEDVYVSCAHACVVAAMAESPSLFAANCAHRAYFDTPPDRRLDLDLFAKLALTVPAEKLSEMLST